MNQQFDFFSRSVELFRSLTDVFLENSEELIALQIENGQTYVNRGSHQLRLAMSEVFATDAPAALHTGFCKSFELTREAVLANSQCQVETLRLLQLQAAERQQRLRVSFAESWLAMQELGAIAGSSTVPASAQMQGM
ncbi:MAG: hypothetical protein HYU74_00415 [Dechloromonas sp.]|nr:hypothetical protein [Dechloromonas sp.]